MRKLLAILLIFTWTGCRSLDLQDPGPAPRFSADENWRQPRNLAADKNVRPFYGLGRQVGDGLRTGWTVITAVPGVALSLLTAPFSNGS